ncbi:T9SS type A sorting domain-containing protein [Aureispira anguillae]|nr:T9SS type A sorting domain-containing protein [Aureispira anguillae]
MKNNNLFLTCLLLLSLGIMGLNSLSAQCPNCTINLPAGIPADTIVVDSLPAAYKNAYYEESMSYRLPYTTDPLAAVAPPGTNVPAGLTIDHFKVLSVTGLPPGLSWIGDRPAPMTYNEAAPQTRDGCITLCGTPGASGVFIVNVNLEIQISGFVFPSPPIPLEFTVFPDTNASFTVDTSAGCAPFGVVINNLVPSNGNPGFSYFWDFNNGDTSTLENPDTVWYDFNMTSDTTVAIEQQVVIDTFPYLLESIVVATDPGNSCNDDVGIAPLVIPGAPDMYIVLIGGGDTINTDPNFALIGNTQNNEYPRDTMVFPGPIELSAGQTYSLEIWDDDSALGPLDNDDPCGSGPMSLSASLGAGVHTLTSGSMTVEVTISHYIDTITYVDSVLVRYCNVPISYINKVDRSLLVYPNPTSNFVHVQFQLNGLEENVELVLSDVLGRTVYTEQIQGFEGDYNRQVDLTNQSEGVYLLQLRVGDQVIPRKIVLRK